MSSRDLLLRIPAFLRRLAEVDTFTALAMADVLAVSDLEPHAEAGLRTRLSFDYPNDGDNATLERRLRTAVTRELGKPTGGDKHWDAGCVTATVRCRAKVVLSLTPQYSLTRLRTAAVSWLDGMNIREWLVESGFVDADAGPDSEGRWPRPDDDHARASVTTTEDRPARISLLMESGVRPPGMLGNTASERWDQSLDFLAAQLGDPPRTGWWHRGSRSFSVRGGLSSYARSIDFSQAPAGKVYGPHQLVTIPSSPDPDPAAAAGLLQTLSTVRGMPEADAVTTLAAAGAITDGPPRRRPGVLVLTSSSGQPLKIGLVDGRFARAVVQATCATTWDAVVPTFTEKFGESESYGFDTRWHLGPMAVTHVGSWGVDGFERLRYEVAEDTKQSVRAAESWLLDAKPPDELRAVDAWQARCLGAELSGAVVPAAVAGQPVWQVDDRILWLQEGRVHGAGPGGWPQWAAGMPAAGTSSPAPPEQLTSFVDAVVGWRDAGLDEAVATLVDLSWTTTDPDALTHPREEVAFIRLLCPAGANFSVGLRDGRLNSWDVTLADRRSPSSHAGVASALEEILAPYADRVRGGFTLGEFGVHLSRGGRLDLTGRLR